MAEAMGYQAMGYQAMGYFFFLVFPFVSAVFVFALTFFDARFFGALTDRVRLAAFFGFGDFFFNFFGPTGPATAPAASSSLST